MWPTALKQLVFVLQVTPQISVLKRRSPLMMKRRSMPTSPMSRHQTTSCQRSRQFVWAIDWTSCRRRARKSSEDISCTILLNCHLA